MGQQRGLDDIYNHLYTSVLGAAERLRLKYISSYMYVFVYGGSKGAWIEISYHICICMYAGVLRAAEGLGLKYI